MDKPVEAKVAGEPTEVPALDPREITPEQMQQVAGGQNGAGSGPPH